MDKKTFKVLQGISMSIPKSLLKKALKMEREDSTEDAALSLLQSRLLSDKAKKNLKIALERGDFAGKMVQNIDPKYAKEIDQYLATKVDQAIRKGLIPKASKDSFIKDISKKLQ